MKLTKKNIEFVGVHMDAHGRYHDWCVRLKDGDLRTWFRTKRKGVSIFDSILPEELPKSVQNFIADGSPEIQAYNAGLGIECVIRWETVA